MINIQAKFMDKKIILAVFLFLLLSTALLKIYFVNGVDWDFAAHYLSAKSADSNNFLNVIKEEVISKQTTMQVGVVEKGKIYFESYRAPLSIAFFMVLYPLLGHNSAIAYLMIMVILLFYATLYFSKKLGINYLFTASLFALPYILIFTFVVNSEGMLSLILMIIALSFESDNKWQSGIFIGLAGLAKYTSLIFLPMLLLLQGRKNILKGYLSFVIVTLPWLVFNYIIFGNPLYSYLSSISVSLESSAPSPISLTAIFTIVAFFIPAIIISILLSYWYFKEKKKGAYQAFRKNVFKRPLIILISFLSLSIVEFIILGRHESPFDQARYAYFLYSALAFLIAYTIDKLISLIKNDKAYLKKSIIHNSDIILFLFSAATIVGALVILNTGMHANLTSGSQNSIFTDVVSETRELNMYNCTFVSNDWVYLRYYNITAYSPYFYNSSIKAFPVIVINSIGTSSNAVYIGLHKKIYSNDSFSIYLSNSSNEQHC